MVIIRLPCVSDIFRTPLSTPCAFLSVPTCVYSICLDVYTCGSGRLCLDIFPSGVSALFFGCDSPCTVSTLKRKQSCFICLFFHPPQYMISFLVFITSAKEVMFSPASVCWFCLLVYLSAGLRKKY